MMAMATQEQIDGVTESLVKIMPLGQAQELARAALEAWERKHPAAAGGEPARPARLSVLCRLYGSNPHNPCSGTTDDGTGALCEHWCHPGGETE